MQRDGRPTKNPAALKRSGYDGRSHCHLALTPRKAPIFLRCGARSPGSRLPTCGAFPPGFPSSGQLAAFVPNTVAGAAPASHRLPSTLQRASVYKGCSIRSIPPRGCCEGANRSPSQRRTFRLIERIALRPGSKTRQVRSLYSRTPQTSIEEPARRPTACGEQTWGTTMTPSAPAKCALP